MNTSLRLLLLSTILWACIYALGVIRITEPLTKTMLLALSPVLTSINRVKIQVKNEFAVITEARTITNKYRALNEQNLQLRNEVAQLTLMQEENSKLREQLGAPELDKFKLVPAKIVSKENGLTVVYDKIDTVMPGAIVVYKNNFVGKVRTATNRTASIILLTDPAMQMPISILNNDKKAVKGIGFGQFGTGFTADRIEQNEQIQKGNVVTLDKAPGTPAGVVVGEVTEIRKIESELFQAAKVVPYIDLDSLDTVFIIQ